ncbi:MAG TPA: MlaD family protein [Thermoleophilaceae bacterium]
MARLLTVAAIALAVGAVGWLLLAGRSSYRVTLVVDNASQLVKGNHVKVGGVPVGQVTKLELGDDARAEVEIEIRDDELTPLHRGTTAEIRSTSLSGIANRYVALVPGRNDAPEIASGGRLPAEDAQAEVDLDAILNTLDPDALNDLQLVIRGLGDAVGGRGKELAGAIKALNPALSQSAVTAKEIVREEPSLARFLVQTSKVVAALDSRESDVERLVPATGAALSAIASRTTELDDSLRRLPQTLRSANTTLVNLRALLAEARPVVREARPSAPLLTDTLTRLRTVARRGTPLLPGVRRLVDGSGRLDLVGVVRDMPAVERTAVPAFDSATATVEDLIPIVAEARPYTPDLVGGPLRGFGGTTSTYYDANGRYTRISAQGTGYTLTGSGTLTPLMPSQGGLAGFRSGVRNRCPGAATQPGPDGSNPWLPEPGFPCDLSESPR